MAIGTINVPPSRAQEWTTQVLEQVGVKHEHASIVAKALVLADLRGVDTHGINRLPGYLDRIKAGSLNISPSLQIEQKTPVMACLDAESSFGFVAGHTAINHSIQMAETFGIGITAVRNSSHFGMAATYLLQAIEKGFAAMVFTNASRSMPPWGSKEPLLGTSPMAIGFHGGEKGDFVLDMSPSVVARGKVRKAARRGEQIPEGWMLDAEGRATTDPHAALKGTVLPIGGPKGSGLAAMMDIFGGLITGASFAGDVNDQYSDVTKPQGVGHWFMVFKPEAFLGSREEYLERMDTLMDRIRDCAPAEGVTRIYTPGEIEADRQKTREKTGIPYTPQEVEALHDFAASLECSARLFE
ncbi:hypothetical protein PRZ48_003899 [Zasmidium cellare]|uniref:Malate dehydrogenase n=1 Tax=Zasmidium cellare TaxID=395010 RepID=A0ABR0EX52_ZASCE|nr:hypothetical protein PRZ48_003899 [Zasmidium cellare]